MKAPAFQFYPTDYIASQRVQMLTLEEEGAYIRLLCYCWQHGSIPSDPDQLARLIGKGASTTLATVVAAMFDQGPTEGRLIHSRLEHERQKQAAWREKSAEGGRKSSEKRKGGSRVVEPPCQPNANTPSSSPSSTSDLLIQYPPTAVGVQGGTASPPPAKHTRKRVSKVPDSEWLAGLKTDAAFVGIDIDREFAKATRWHTEKNRVLTRGRFVAWLNRVDRPLVTTPEAPRFDEHGEQIW